MTTIDVTTLAGIMRDAAKAEILPRFRRLDRSMVSQKTEAIDLVTEADLAAERVITARIGELWPEIEARGPQAADVAKVQEMMRRSIETGLEQNGTWLSQILSYDHLGLPLAEIPSEHRYVDALTPERLRAAARRYFDTSQYVQVSLYPETMRGKATP